MEDLQDGVEGGLPSFHPNCCSLKSKIHGNYFYLIEESNIVRDIFML